VGLNHDAPRLDLGADGAIAENHGRRSLFGGSGSTPQVGLWHADTSGMEPREDQGSHHVKRVVLPSGKTIEVVYFKDAAEEETSFRTVVEPHQDLQVCPDCDSKLVYPTEWNEAGAETWQVKLRCPECQSVREGVFSAGTVEAFDEQLDRGTDELMADYRRLCRANMAEEVERLVAALESDLLLPEDF
jgi:hypothetical protein